MTNQVIEVNCILDTPKDGNWYQLIGAPPTMEDMTFTDDDDDNEDKYGNFIRWSINDNVYHFMMILKGGKIGTTTINLQ